MTEQIKYSNKQKQLLHQLIEAVFSSQELDKFCADFYEPVLDQFSANDAPNTKIRTLVEYCAQHNQLGKLTAHIEGVKPNEYHAFVEQVQAGKSEDARPPSTHVIAVVSDRGEIIASPDALLSRSLAGRYRIDQILDQSGLGAVFKAYDTQLGLEIAVKVINLNRVHLPTLRERVRQEVQLTMKLNHSGIVQFYDSGQTDSLIYVVMEFIRGYNLQEAHRQLMALHPQGNLPQVIELMRQISSTVDYLHQQGVLHPSTAPENIMLKTDGSGGSLGQPVLINLGLLRPHREAIKAHEEIPASKLAYTASPELLLHHGTDIRSDVYALGVLLYDLVVGRPPFNPQNIAEATRLHVETPPPSPRSINPNVPEALEHIILKALAKKPADRYLTVQEFSQALKEITHPPRLPVSPGSQSVAVPKKAAPKLTFSLKWVTGVMLAVVLVLLAVFVLVLNVEEDAIERESIANLTNAHQTATAVAQATQAVQAQAGATETVAWQAQDSDRDGLPNGVEDTQYKTLPDNPDTDGDGLSDGKEVLEFSTDPLNKDTDSDGVLDDEEIRRGWDPNNRDTDADGTPDAFEPDPGNLPTPTPTFTPSSLTPTLTPHSMTMQFSSRQSFVDVLSSGQWPRYKVDENAGRAIIEVSLSPPAVIETQVEYRIRDSNAIQGQDYTFQNGLLIFEAGDSLDTIELQIIDDNERESDEVIVLELYNASPPGIEIETRNADLIIVDDETPHPWGWLFD